MITLIAMDASEKLVLRYCFGINILHSVCLAINVRYPLSFFFCIVRYPSCQGCSKLICQCTNEE